MDRSSLRGPIRPRQGLAADPAAIRADSVQLSSAGAPGRLAVAPVHEGLRIGEGRCLGNRETHPGIDGVVRNAAFAPKAGAWNDVAGAVIGEDLRLFQRPIDGGGVDRLRFVLRRATRDVQRLDESHRDLVGIAA
jgi:hypothetical protein